MNMGLREGGRKGGRKGGREGGYGLVKDEEGARGNREKEGGRLGREGGREGGGEGGKDGPAGDLVGDLDEVVLELFVVVRHPNALPSPALRRLEHHRVA
jgi:hypothetical protein